MKILWLTLESILPSNTGGRIGVYKRLEQIAKTNEIYLFYPYDDEKELKYKMDLEKICSKVYAYSRRKNKINGVKNLFKYPYTVSSRKFSSMEDDIKECIRENNIDVINVDFPHMCVNLKDLSLDIPIVLNEHNIEWKVYKNISKSHKNVIKKFLYFIDSYRLKNYEKELFDRIHFSKVTFVSSKDMRFMIDEQLVNIENAELIPVGADIQNFHIKKDHRKKVMEKNIIFVGKMSYGPNVEAVKWFVKDVMPLLSENINNLKFYIVGKDPTEEVKRLANDNIIVTGMVESVSDYYDIADLVVLPLQNGGGVKVKLLEAISYRKPIVSTSIGVEGTYYAEYFIPVADQNTEFAKLCLDILEDNVAYPEKSIYSYFIENYTWEHIGEKYSKMFREVLENRDEF